MAKRGVCRVEPKPADANQWRKAPSTSSHQNRVCNLRIRGYRAVGMLKLPDNEGDVGGIDLAVGFV